MNKEQKVSKNELKKFFAKYDNEKTPVEYRHDGYSNCWYVSIYQKIEFDTMADLIAAGYQFDVLSWGDYWVRVKIY